MSCRLLNENANSGEHAAATDKGAGQSQEPSLAVQHRTTSNYGLASLHHGAVFGAREAQGHLASGGRVWF